MPARVARARSVGRRRALGGGGRPYATHTERRPRRYSLPGPLSGLAHLGPPARARPDQKNIKRDGRTIRGTRTLKPLHQTISRSPHLTTHRQERGGARPAGGACTGAGAHEGGGKPTSQRIAVIASQSYFQSKVGSLGSDVLVTARHSFLRRHGVHLLHRALQSWLSPSSHCARTTRAPRDGPTFPVVVN